jgi:general transcription factor 3C polypeptide 5 (transcription factor C subunit 1)
MRYPPGHGCDESCSYCQFLDAPPSEQKPILVKLRPDDAFARGINGTQCQTRNILLKVRLPKRTGRKRRRGSDDPFVPDPEYGSEKPMPVDAKTFWTMLRDNPENYTVNPVGVIPETYRFRTIPDLQYSTASNALMTNMRSTLLSDDFDLVKTFRLDPAKGILPNQETQPPPSMSIARLPLPYGYRQNDKVKYIRDANGTLESVNTALGPKIIVHVVPFDAPTVPSSSPVPLPPENTLDPRVRDCLGRLREAQKTRPIMSRRVQMALGRPATEDSLKPCWGHLGYMFRSGPFKDVLVAFGIDPRVDPKYRIYQSVSIQIPESKRGRKDRFGEPAIDAKKTYLFDGAGVFVDGRVWQVCDVTDPQLNRYLERAEVSDHFESTTSGWYNNGTWALFRTVLKDKVLNLVNGKPKSDGFYDPAFLTWPEHLDKETASLAKGNRRVSQDLAKIMTTARSRALQALKLEQDEIARQKRLRGEDVTVEEHDVIMGDGDEDVDDAELGVQLSTDSDEEAEMRSSDEENNDDDND